MVVPEAWPDVAAVRSISVANLSLCRENEQLVAIES